jgi:hypothetical protein
MALVRAVTGVVAGSRFFRFHRPLRVSERQQDGVWVQECKPLNIAAYGPTRTAAWTAFVKQFESTWDWIVVEKDSRLTEGAQALKRTYLDAVEAVEQIL